MRSLAVNMNYLRTSITSDSVTGVGATATAVVRPTSRVTLWGMNNPGAVQYSDGDVDHDVWHSVI
jgi:hypothetical protein